MHKDFLPAFHSMDKLDQLSALGGMIFNLSLDGRDSYAIDGDVIENPSRLSRINELIHRISSLHTQIASESNPELDSNIDGVFNTIDHEISLLKITWSYLLA